MSIEPIARANPRNKKRVGPILHFCQKGDCSNHSSKPRYTSENKWEKREKRNNPIDRTDTHEENNRHRTAPRSARCRASPLGKPWTAWSLFRMWIGSGRDCTASQVFGFLAKMTFLVWQGPTGEPDNPWFWKDGWIGGLVSARGSFPRCVHTYWELVAWWFGGIMVGWRGSRCFNSRRDRLMVGSVRRYVLDVSARLVLFLGGPGCFLSENSLTLSWTESCGKY